MCMDQSETVACVRSLASWFILSLNKVKRVHINFRKYPWLVMLWKFPFWMFLSSDVKYVSSSILLVKCILSPLSKFNFAIIFGPSSRGGSRDIIVGYMGSPSVSSLYFAFPKKNEVFECVITRIILNRKGCQKVQARTQLIKLKLFF